MPNTYDMVVISLKKLGYIEEMFDILRDLTKTDRDQLAEYEAVVRRARSLLKRWEKEK